MDPRLSLPLGASVALCLTFFALPSYAEVRSGDTVVVEAGEVVEENLYASGGTVAIRGAVRGDLCAPPAASCC